MYSLFPLALVSCLLSLIATPFCRDFARRRGILDKPDFDRKVHVIGTPRIGGVPVILSYVAAYLLLLASPLNAGVVLAGHIGFVTKVFPAVALVFATGLIDDLIGLTWWQKLLGQIAGALWAYWAGVRILGIGAYAASDAWWTLPLTVGWLVACCNAFNLIDGVDGLAAGVGLLATLTTFLAGILHNNVQLALATLPLAGALIGFLRYNFNPASIFLGDCGSLSIGFLLGAYAVIWSQKSATVLALTAPVVTLAIPLLEMTLSIARRYLRNRPIFSADRGHIHHRLLAKGLTPRRVALLLYACCGVAAAVSLLQSMLDQQFAGLAVVLFCGAAWFGIQHLGYMEFGVAGKLLMGGGFRSTLNAQIALRDLEDRMASAHSLDGCWRALLQAAQAFGFNEVTLRFGSDSWHETLHTPAGSVWKLHIPLAGDNYVELNRELGRGASSLVVIPAFVDTVSKGLCGYLPRAVDDFPRVRANPVLVRQAASATRT